MIHILVLGQSNVANHGQPRATSDFGGVFHAGACLPLSDPIPGGSGEGGSVWTRFAPLMRDSNLAPDLRITLRAQGGTAIADWSKSGKHFEELLRDLPAIRSCPVPVTHVLYHQGERDTMLGTDEVGYVSRFLELHDAVSGALPQAEWIVCRASYRMGVTSETVRRAQDAIVARLSKCRAGFDTDQLGSEYRYDDTHFNEKGLQAFARGLLDCFRGSGI